MLAWQGLWGRAMNDCRKPRFLGVFLQRSAVASESEAPRASLSAQRFVHAPLWNPAPDAEDRRPGRIRVDRAEYGFRTDQCDATDAVRQSATGRRSLEVLANNQLCGDSAPNRPKTLTVSYRCGWDGAVQRASVREGTAMRLACR